MGSGHVWVTGGLSGILFALDPNTGSITRSQIDPPARAAGPNDEQFPWVGFDLTAIVYASGDVWVCCGPANETQGVDTRSMRVDATINIACGPWLGAAPGASGLWMLTSCASNVGPGSVAFVSWDGLPHVGPYSEHHVFTHSLNAFGYVAVSRPEVVPDARQQTLRAIAAAFGQVWVAYGNPNRPGGRLDRFDYYNGSLQPIAVPASWFHRSWVEVALGSLLAVSVLVAVVRFVRRRRVEELTEP